MANKEEVLKQKIDKKRAELKELGKQLETLTGEKLKEEKPKRGEILGDPVVSLY